MNIHQLISLFYICVGSFTNKMFYKPNNSKRIPDLAYFLKTGKLNYTP